MIGVCMVCNAEGEVELHHVAGELNDPFTVVPLCRWDHLFQTSHQWTSGVNSRPPHLPEFLDRLRACLVGLATLEEAHLTHLGRRADAHRARVRGRWYALILDCLGSAERPGRWTPNSKLRRRRLNRARNAILAAGEVTPVFQAHWDRVLADSPVLHEADDRIHAFLADIDETQWMAMTIVAGMIWLLWWRGRNHEKEIQRMRAHHESVSV